MAETKSYSKIIEQIEKMSLLEVSELVKALEEKFGVSAAMPVAAPVAQSAAVEAPAEEEKSEYKVTLKEFTDKIKTIKALRSVISINLTDARKLVEEAPSVVSESMSKDDANKLKTALEEAGAKVELS